MFSEELVGNGKTIFAAAVQQGHEGVMAKHRASRYLPGRRHASWKKIKPVQVLPAVIVGYQPGGAAVHSLLVAGWNLLRSAFLKIVPVIETHGRVVFRYLKCPQAKADAIAEMIALTWLWFVRLSIKGKDPNQFPFTLAYYAARAVKSGRRLCGQEKSKDVLSCSTRRQRGFEVHTFGDRNVDAYLCQDALRDNTQTPVPDQVSFRCDFPRWLQSQTSRDRRIAEELMLGEGTKATARKYGLSPSRIAQLRQEFHADWMTFCGGTIFLPISGVAQRRQTPDTFVHGATPLRRESIQVPKGRSERHWIVFPILHWCSHSPKHLTRSYRISGFLLPGSTSLSPD